jgi:hypothetical protein
MRPFTVSSVIGIPPPSPALKPKSELSEMTIPPSGAYAWRTFSEYGLVSVTLPCSPPVTMSMIPSPFMSRTSAFWPERPPEKLRPIPPAMGMFSPPLSDQESLMRASSPMPKCASLEPPPPDVAPPCRPAWTMPLLRLLLEEK